MPSMSRYPDEENALMEVLEQWGETELLETEKVDLNSLTSPVADIRIATADGEESWPHRIAFTTVIVAAPGRGAAKRIAEEITEYLSTGPTVSPTWGLLDKCEVTMTPRLLPVAANMRTLYQVDFAIHTRARF